ncbi:MAG: hypothetical protein K6E70_05130 [Butyrivibrio sp.]|nr:hypothetical protein [Butyrivibrio sp.]
MHFQITTFCFLFLTFLLFHIAPGKIRRYILLAASVFFIYWQGKELGIIALAIISLFTFICGLLVSVFQKNKNMAAEKSAAACGIIILAAVLFGWKYLSFGAYLIGASVPERVTRLGMPIGLSFYIFQAISYIADVKLQKIVPEKNPISFALYMMWFPKWMSGPIERAGDFIENLEKSERTKLFDFERFIRVLSFLIWGLFMKLVIADRVGIVVDTVFEQKEMYGSLVLILTSLLYTIQIYCDFAGYTNIVIGISLMFGIELTQNFRTPYFTENIVKFWRGWHISLSNFFRDYIYIPLGGNRKGSARKALNILIVFLVCGMWHGAGFTFIIWGLIHGIMNVITNSLSKSKAAFLVKGMVGRVISFCIVSFAWIFFRAATLTDAFGFIKGMLPFMNAEGLRAGLQIEDKLMLGLSLIEWWIAGLSIALLTIMDGVSYRKKLIPPELISSKWGDFSRGLMFAFLALVILVFGRYGAGEEIRSFVYAQF